MRFSIPCLALCSVAFLGCASGGGSESRDVRRNSNLISQEELELQPGGSAYDAVERLRANWLRSRSSTLSGGVGGTVHLPRIFVDEREFGGVNTLRQFHVDSVLEIEYMSARDATTRYGTGYPGGIIHVKLKRLSSGPMVM